MVKFLSKRSSIYVMALLLILVSLTMLVRTDVAAQSVGGPSAFCHVTDGEFTDCPSGDQEWSDITPTFFPDTNSYLYADQADLDPNLAGPVSPMDTFMLMYDECAITEPLGPDEYFLVYFNTIEEKNGLPVYENYVIHLFTDGTIMFIENGDVEEDANGNTRSEEIQGQRGDVGFGPSPHCPFDHVFAEFEVKLSITGPDLAGALSPGFNLWLSVPPPPPPPPPCKDNLITVPLKINVLDKVQILNTKLQSVVEEANKLLEQAGVCSQFDANNIKRSVNDQGNNDGKLLTKDEYQKQYQECVKELGGKGFKIFVTSEIGKDVSGVEGAWGIGPHDGTSTVYPCVWIREKDHPNLTLGKALAHEIAHIFTNMKHCEDDPNCTDTADNLLNKNGTGNKLESHQIDEIKTGANTRKGNSAIGSWTDPPGDVSEPFIDLFTGFLFAEDLTSPLDITTSLAGFFPNNTVNLKVEMFFDTDNDLVTGSAFSSFNGIDKVLEISLTGVSPFTPPDGLISANLIDVASNTSTPITPGLISTVETISDTFDPAIPPTTTPAFDSIHQSVPASALGLSSPVVPGGVRATNIDSGEFDETSFKLNTGIVPVGVFNGSFENANCNLDGWDTQSGSAANSIASLGPLGSFTPITPFDGNCMAVISTSGSALTPPGTRGSVIRQTFVVPDDADTVDFFYQYVSNDSGGFENFFLAQLDTDLGTFTLGSADNAGGSPAGGVAPPPPPQISPGVSLTPPSAPTFLSGVNILGSGLFIIPSSQMTVGVCSSFPIPPALRGTEVTLRLLAGDALDTAFDSVGIIDGIVINGGPLFCDVGGVPDRDGDTIPDELDNCPIDPNTDQADSNFNGIGDACEVPGELYTTSAYLNATIEGSTESEETSLIIGNEPPFDERLKRIVEYHVNNGLVPSAEEFAQNIVNSLVEIGQVPASEAEALVNSVVNDPPVADANGPYTGTAGVPITFDGSASFDPDGTIVQYEWDFEGDGVFDSVSADPTATHTYAAPFVGSAELRVTDDSGEAATDTASVEVVAAGCPDDVLISNYQTDPANDQFVEVANVGDGPINLSGCSLVTFDVFTETSIGDATVGLSGTLTPGQTVRVNFAGQLPPGPGAIGIYNIAPPPDGTPFSTENEITGMVYLDNDTVFAIGHLTKPEHNSIYQCIYGGSGQGQFDGPFPKNSDCLPQ